MECVIDRLSGLNKNNETKSSSKKKKKNTKKIEEEEPLWKSAGRKLLARSRSEREQFDRKRRNIYTARISLLFFSLFFLLMNRINTQRTRGRDVHKIRPRRVVFFFYKRINNRRNTQSQKEKEEETVYGVIDHYFSDWSRLTQDLVSARAVKMIRFSSTPARAIYDGKKKGRSHSEIIRGWFERKIMSSSCINWREKECATGGRIHCASFHYSWRHAAAQCIVYYIFCRVFLLHLSLLFFFFFSSGLIIAFTILMKYSWANQRLQHGLDWINPQLSSPRSESTTAQAKGKKTPPTAYINTRLHAMQ